MGDVVGGLFGGGKPPQPQPIQPDPELEQMRKASAAESLSNMQSMTQGDLSNLLARYGQLLGPQGAGSRGPVFSSPGTISGRTGGLLAGRR